MWGVVLPTILPTEILPMVLVVTLLEMDRALVMTRLILGIYTMPNNWDTPPDARIHVWFIPTWLRHGALPVFAQLIVIIPLKVFAPEALLTGILICLPQPLCLSVEQMQV
jgi:hypothetical protein